MAPPTSGPREIRPGILHANLIAGELVVDAGAAATKPSAAAIRVCVDEAAVVAATLTRSSAVPGYDEAVLAAVAAWRFTPFLRDGVPEAVCTDVQFFTAGWGPRGPRDKRPALPPAERALPPSRIVEGGLPAEALGQPATPAVAAVLRCRRRGTDDAMAVTLVQSSGDLAADDALLTAPLFRLVEEAPDTTPRCTVAATIVRPSAPRPPPQPVPARDPAKPPIAVEQRRIVGDPRIVPSARVKLAIDRLGLTRVMVPVKVCLDVDGAVAAVTIVTTSGFPAYDLDLINAVATWRYEPMTVDGQAVKVCSIVQFAYNQVPAPP